jgi:hypothetical protein
MKSNNVNFITMKRLSMFMVVAILATMLAVSCGSGNGKSDTPSGVVEQWYDYIIDGKYEEVLSLLPTNFEGKSEAEIAKEKAQWVALCKMSYKTKLPEKAEIISEEIAEDGLSATVKTKLYFNDGTSKDELFKPVKINGVWKIKLF